MFGFDTRPSRGDQLQKIFDSDLAIIEYDPAGRILCVNDNLCKMTGYPREQMVGKHHSIFVDPDYARSPEYREFWAKLARGEPLTQEYKRNVKGGHVWVQANYRPIVNAKGAIERIVNYLTDVSAHAAKKVDFEAIVNAISRAQAMVEFTPAGEIVDANENFLRTVGYSLDEIKGRHHRMLVEPAVAQSPEYAALWQKVQHGEPVADIFKRIGKGGKVLLLQASYNPVLGLDGRVAKVIKFATDISDLVELGASLARLAANDMEKPISQTFQPMFEPIKRDFNTAQEKLRSTMLRVADNVEAVAASGKEIASASENLSHRTEEEAASLEETAAALAAVTDTVKKTATGANRAREVASESGRDAEKSGEIVNRAVAAMGRIEKSSQQIGQIIGVIDEIAFQTNLLALNAGVEAARAGDAGKGFAVVASEVRALAQRSAEAAKEIKGLISASTEEVSDGVKLVAETGQSLSRIIAKVGEINTLIGEIASGADGQSASLHEVNIAVKRMDEAVQQNAAMAEEASAAARALLQELQSLAASIDEFRVGRPEKSAAPTAEAKPSVVRPTASRTRGAGAQGGDRPCGAGAPAASREARRRRAAAPPKTTTGRNSNALAD